MSRPDADAVALAGLAPWLVVPFGDGYSLVLSV